MIYYRGEVKAGTQVASQHIYLQELRVMKGPLLALYLCSFLHPYTLQGSSHEMIHIQKLFVIAIFVAPEFICKHIKGLWLTI